MGPNSRSDSRTNDACKLGPVVFIWVFTYSHVHKWVVAYRVFEYKKIRSIVISKAVHGSSQPGFGPNPHSTRLDRVTEKKTRNQLKNGLNPPGRIIGLNGSDHRFERVGPLIGPFL